jgi:hypothetical protein
MVNDPGKAGMGSVPVRMNWVKLRRGTRAASCGASEAPPYEAGTVVQRYKPKLNTYALYPRCKHRGITIKMKLIPDLNEALKN